MAEKTNVEWQSLLQTIVTHTQMPASVFTRAEAMADLSDWLIILHALFVC